MPFFVSFISHYFHCYFHNGSIIQLLHNYSQSSRSSTSNMRTKTPPPPYTSEPSAESESAKSVSTYDHNDYSILGSHHNVLIVDDGSPEAAWDDIRQAVQSISEDRVKYSTVSLHFFNHSSSDPEVDGIPFAPGGGYPIASSQAISTTFDQVSPIHEKGFRDGSMGQKLKDILRYYSLHLCENFEDYDPINFIVVSAIMPSGVVERIITGHARTLDRLQAPPQQSRIRFLHIGNNEACKQILRIINNLKERQIRNMVDSWTWNRLSGKIQHQGERIPSQDTTQRGNSVR
jgi:hypothetical protein